MLAKPRRFSETGVSHVHRNLHRHRHAVQKGALDETTLERLIKLQIKGGVDGIVPVGTTGESPTVDYEEHLEIIALTVKYAAGKVKVLAGTGANSTSEAVYLTREAEKIGADGSLQVAPYYNKPSQEGLFQHFRAIARETKLPIVLYSIPGRCGVEIGEPLPFGQYAEPGRFGENENLWPWHFIAALTNFPSNVTAIEVKAARKQ